MVLYGMVWYGMTGTRSGSLEREAGYERNQSMMAEENLSVSVECIPLSSSTFRPSSLSRSLNLYLYRYICI